MTTENSPEYAAKTSFTIDSGISRCTMAAGGSVVLRQILEGYRNHLPEPLDVADHIGNASISILIGGVAALFMSNAIDPGTSLRRGKVIAGTLGLGLGVLANGIVDTQIGFDILNSWLCSSNSECANILAPTTTVDTIDFIYGSVIAGAAGALGPHYVKADTMIERPYDWQLDDPELAVN